MKICIFSQYFGLGKNNRFSIVAQVFYLKVKFFLQTNRLFSSSICPCGFAFKYNKNLQYHGDKRMSGARSIEFLRFDTFYAMYLLWC